MIREMPLRELPDYAARLTRAAIPWRPVPTTRADVIVIETDRDLLAYEAALELAKELWRRSGQPDPTVSEIVAADDALKLQLMGTDRFWVRWSAWRDARLPAGHPNRAVYGDE